MSHSYAHVAPSITPQRWAYLKALKLSQPRYIHVSCEAKMIVSPIPGTDMPKLIPFVAKGTTYNVGRNANKRYRRALAAI